MLLNTLREKILTQPKPDQPDWETVKAVIGNSVSLAMAMLAVATYCNSKPNAKAFKKALKFVGYANTQLAVKDLDQIEPLFAAALADLKKFRERLLEGKNCG